MEHSPSTSDPFDLSTEDGFHRSRVTNSRNDLVDRKMAALVSYVVDLAGPYILRHPEMWPDNRSQHVPSAVRQWLAHCMVGGEGVWREPDSRPPAAAQGGPRRSWIARWLRRTALGALLLVGAAALMVLVVAAVRVYPQISAAIDQGVVEAKAEFEDQRLQRRAPTPAGADARPVAPAGGFALDARGVPYDPGTFADRTTGDMLSAMEQRIVVDLVAARGIATRAASGAPAGKRIPFVVFSDPNCPSCRQFERTLEAVDQRYLPVVVPVAFLPGSEDLVARVMCSADRAEAWRLAVGGKAVETPVCEAGREGVVQSNGAFVALRLSHTPTYVGPAGNVASGAASAPDLTSWLDASVAAAEPTPSLSRSTSNADGADGAANIPPADRPSDSEPSDSEPAPAATTAQPARR